MATLAVLLAVWWAVAALQLISPLFLPPPGQVLAEAYHHRRAAGLYGCDALAAPGGEPDADSLSPCWRQLLIGVPVGIAMGLNSTVRGILDPLIELYRPVPRRWPTYR
ncbi:Taurine transport system permease TauC [Klebsiella pneumoniae subsp. ozaenae]|uniref:Taurine transport system permease TauC n=1 Tax=Klebsiella pneumoniae subsp. ozaenae TaxID=574 RepID=A0A378BXS0_KLEPO|nr:Taurine transport system permease TauC [Klebsiella pneumoniae subsp. ozaenae]